MFKVMWFIINIRNRLIRTLKINYEEWIFIKAILIMIMSFIISLIIPIAIGLNRFVIVSIMITLLVHELGHYFSMRYYKCENIKIIFFGLVAITQTDSIIESRFKRIVISLAGPLPGIILGLILMFTSDNESRLNSFAKIMVLINAVNLIPISMLDGGNIFENLFVLKHYRATGIFSILSGLFILTYCVLTKDFSVIVFCVINLIRGVLLIRDKSLSTSGNQVNPLAWNHKIILLTVWIFAIFISFISI